MEYSLTYLTEPVRFNFEFQRRSQRNRENNGTVAGSI
jgi:hypothetical protein